MRMARVVKMFDATDDCLNIPDYWTGEPLENAFKC